MTRMYASILLASTLSVGVTATARAQSASVPAADVFVGYSLFPANGDDFPRTTSHGVQAGVAVPLNRWFGLAAEYAEQWSSSSDLGPNFAGLTAETRVRELLVGPRFTARGRRADVFGQGWFGRATGDAGDNISGFSDSGVAFGGGGGVDVRLTPRVAIRTQFDYVGSFADMVENNTRFSTGVVVGFGGR